MYKLGKYMILLKYFIKNFIILIHLNLQYFFFFNLLFIKNLIIGKNRLNYLSYDIIKY